MLHNVPKYAEEPMMVASCWEHKRSDLILRLVPKISASAKLGHVVSNGPYLNVYG
jgi:hypothetical protein